MRVVMAILAVFLIGKDIAYAPFPYELRVVAEGLCLLFGGVALLSCPANRVFPMYWPALGYVSVLLLGAPFSQFPLFALLQIISLASVIVFSIAYFERYRENRKTALWPLLISIIAMYGLATLASIVFAKIQPTAAYEAQFAGNMVGYEMRFRGLFSKAGMMGAAAGILVGLAAICIKRISLKLVLVVSGAICLALTQSRTFWLAALFSGAATTWRYYPRFRRIVVWIGCAGIAVACVMMAFAVRLDTTAAEKFARLDTVTTLTGRTGLWAETYQGFRDRPWFGYGFTLGATGLPENRAAISENASQIDPTQLSRQTIHNGYLQSLMDSGLIGLFFYMATICVAMRRLIVFDKERKFPEAMYVLIFLCIANGAESVVYSGAVFQSLCFWVFAVFALGLSREDASQSQIAIEAVLAPRPFKFANLMN